MFTKIKNKAKQLYKEHAPEGLKNFVTSAKKVYKESIKPGLSKIGKNISTIYNKYVPKGVKKFAKDLYGAAGEVIEYSGLVINDVTNRSLKGTKLGKYLDKILDVPEEEKQVVVNKEAKINVPEQTEKEIVEKKNLDLLNFEERKELSELSELKEENLTAIQLYMKKYLEKKKVGDISKEEEKSHDEYLSEINKNIEKEMEKEAASEQMEEKEIEDGKKYEKRKRFIKRFYKRKSRFEDLNNARKNAKKNKEKREEDKKIYDDSINKTEVVENQVVNDNKDRLDKLQSKFANSKSKFFNSSQASKKNHSRMQEIIERNSLKTKIIELDEEYDKEDLSVLSNDELKSIILDLSTTEKLIVEEDLNHSIEEELIIEEELVLEETVEGVNKKSYMHHDEGKIPESNFLKSQKEKKLKAKAKKASIKPKKAPTKPKKAPTKPNKKGSMSNG